MAPSFSKIPVAPTPGISVVSGLMCSHADCCALFSNREDSEAHAVGTHTGRVAAITCRIYKHLSNSGEIRLYRVLDDNGKRGPPKKLKHFTIYLTAGEGSVDEENVLLPPHTKSLTVNGEETSADDPATKDGGKSGQTEFVLASSLLNQLDEASPPNSRSSPPSVEVPPKTGEQTSAESMPSTPSALPFNPTLPCSQPKPSDSQPLSHQSTTSSFEMTSSSSSFNLNDAGDDVKGQLHRILAMVEEIADQCRICWVRKEVTCPHFTFRCPTRICSGNEWQTFRSNLPFPCGVICYFCLAQYDPPFNHARVAPGIKQTPDLCAYPDVLKEIAYILYQDRTLCGKIFARLGVAPPLTLYNYKRYITKVLDGGILGVYKVIGAYLDVRELEESSA